MTLREAIIESDHKKVFRLINKKDSRNIAACDRPTMEQTIMSYTKVIDELLGKPKVKPYSMPWLVEERVDYFDKKKYVDVCFLNPKYVAPAKGLKPWGGKNPPKGHYNCNDNKYNRTFATGFVPWSKLIDTPIINDTKYPLERVVAEILWELTFYGWTEEQTNKRMKEIDKKLVEAMQDIKEGKGIELSFKKKK